MGQLDGHVALVTGGNGGIGLGMARGLARAGAAVAIWGTNPAKNEAATEELVALGARVHAEICNVSDEAQVEASFVRSVGALGKVDSVFANAGIGGNGSAFVDLTLSEWRRVTSVNLEGAFLTMRAGARHFVERGEGGAMVAISSVSAVHGAPRNQPYAASKTALLGMVRGLAVELARHRVRVNAVLPGWTETDMTSRAGEAFVEITTRRTPIRRWLTPADFEQVAVYLADPTLIGHTGDTLVIDGGYSIF